MVEVAFCTCFYPLPVPPRAHVWPSWFVVSGGCFCEVRAKEEEEEEEGEGEEDWCVVSTRRKNEEAISSSSSSTFLSPQSSIMARLLPALPDGSRRDQKSPFMRRNIYKPRWQKKIGQNPFPAGFFLKRFLVPFFALDKSVSTVCHPLLLPLPPLKEAG